MDTTNLTLSLVFGAAGIGYFVFGKKMSLFVPLGAGLGLMVLPYFISNNWLLVMVCLAMMALPFFWRDV
jgi:hypothetical protein